MRMNRTTLVAGDRSQVFHVISRVVDQNFIFEEEEKGKFLSMMRRMEAFTGVEVLSYCLMSNHFHLLLHVPVRPEELTDEEVRDRMAAFYGKKRMAEMDRKIEDMKALGQESYESDLYDGMRGRMYDLSAFVRDLKVGFSKWYNKENGRKGTLWEDRFKSVLVEPTEEAMAKVAAYIELNPVRAELVPQPHEYKWCSFTEAVAGGKLARAGITKIVAGLEGSMNWEKATRLYRSYFLYKAAAQNHSKPGISEEEYYQATQNQGELSQNEIWQTRIRYLTDGLVIGSKSFLNQFLDVNREKIGDHRKNAGFKMESGKTGIFAYRNVK